MLVGDRQTHKQSQSTSIWSPRRLPLREKLEQLSSSSSSAQRAVAVAVRVGPECADHTVLQSSCPPATRPR